MKNLNWQFWTWPRQIRYWRGEAKMKDQMYIDELGKRLALQRELEQVKHERNRLSRRHDH